MLGNMISKIRKDKKITKTELAKMTNVDISHLTHIEKGQRIPSHKLLTSICNSLKVPSRSFFNAYDKNLTEEQLNYNYSNYLPYNKIPAFSNFDGFIECPYNFSNAAFAYKVPDCSMGPLLKTNSYVFIEPCGSLEDKDIGLFFYNGEFYIRRLLYKNGKFVLKANNKNFNNIRISKSDDFTIIGKIYL